MAARCLVVLVGYSNRRMRNLRVKYSQSFRKRELLKAWAKSGCRCIGAEIDLGRPHHQLLSYSNISFRVQVQPYARCSASYRKLLTEDFRTAASLKGAHVHHSAHHFDFAVDWRPADVAVQHGLGILPKWRVRIDSSDPHHFAFDGTSLIIIISAISLRSTA